MAGLTLSVFSLTWAALIIALLACGTWVVLAIRRSFTPVLVFDLVYLLMLEVLCLGALANPVNTAESAFYLITLVTFFLNTAVTLVILYEWGDRPARIHPYAWWLKIAVSITGVYTILPLGLYYLKLYYLPPHAEPGERNSRRLSGDTDGELPGLISVQGAPEVITLPPELGERYRKGSFLGWGGFARVFRVTRMDGTDVAVKLPRMHDTATGRTFIAELQNWTGLEHENIVRVLDFNILPVPFIEMELCDGSLASLNKPLDPVIAAELMYGVCSGLAYSHGRGIIHRDLKPSNILVRDGIPKISDWGLSRVLSESPVTSSQAAFSPQYAAPEQVLGTGKDERTDIWQVGVIFYELVTGHLPFAGENLVETLTAIATRDPEPPSSRVPAAAGTDGIILRCLSRDPAGRYPSARELRAALAGYLETEYTAGLDAAIARADNPGAARYCSSLLRLCVEEGNLPGAYRHASELLAYADWRQRGAVQELMRKIQDAMGGGTGGREILDRAREVARRIGEGADGS